MAENKPGFSLAALARGDERAIVEWIEYHRAIGVGHFTIYGGDDTPMTLLKALTPYLMQATPCVAFRHWGAADDQASARQHFLDNRKQATGWFCFLDVNEFLVFPGSDSVTAFLTTVAEGCAAVSLGVRVFGDNHHAAASDDFILFARTRRAELPDRATKMLVRAGTAGATVDAGTEGAYVAQFARTSDPAFNAVEDHTLAAFWAERTAHLFATRARHSLPPPALPNVALRKPTRQSSRYMGSTGSHLAHAEGRANDGFISGHFGFHTTFEDAPWWMVDLLDVHVLREMRIVNRGDQKAIMNRAANLAIEVSTDGGDWAEAGTLDNHDWTAGTTPELVLRFTGMVLARLVRITSRTPTMLHLDEVEIYGEKFG